MTTWQPPIPAGALYSKAARTLGPALPLLAYCYDLVQRDGWFTISLKDAAGDMEESYQNIKRWWWAIKDGPFFGEIIDQGRKGWKVRFKDIWIDWRILNARQSDGKFAEGTELDLDAEGQVETVVQGHFKVISRSNEGTELDLDTSGNKVLITTDQAGDCERAKSASHTPEQNEQKRAIEQAYVQELGYTPAAFGKEAKAAKWLSQQGYTPDQVVGCYRYLREDEFYQRQHISLAIVSKQIGAWLKLGKSPPKSIRADNRPSLAVYQPKDPPKRTDGAKLKAIVNGEHRDPS